MSLTALVTETIRIPARDDHDGHAAVTVTVLWECPTCGQPRGPVAQGVSFDGSRRLGGVATWKNPCGHVDTYRTIRREAGLTR